MNNRYELYKIKRQIARSGIDVTFKRPILNEFNEPTDNSELVCEIKGLYHEHTAHMLDTYIVPTSYEPGTYRIEKFPQIMCVTDDLYYVSDNGIKEKVKVGDFVFFNGHKAIVTGMKDVMEWNLVCDVSFEEVDNGTLNGA